MDGATTLGEIMTTTPQALPEPWERFIRQIWDGCQTHRERSTIMDAEQIRMDCLRLASACFGQCNSSDDIVSAAQAFAAFVMDKDAAENSTEAETKPSPSGPP